MTPTQTETSPPSRESSESFPAAPPHHDKPRKFRQIMLKAVMVLIVVAGCVIGIHFYLHARGHESTDDAYIAGHIIAISPRVATHVAKVHVDDNEWVKAGDLLVELAPEDFAARLGAAQAALEAAQATFQSSRIDVDLTTVTATSANDEAGANVETARALLETAQALAAASASQRDQARAQIESATAALAQAEAEVDAAKAQQQRDALDLGRNRKLAGSGAVSQQELDHALASERMSSANLAAAEKKVQTQRAMVRQAEASLKAAEDNMRQAGAQVSARKAQLGESQARLKGARTATQQVAKSQSQTKVTQAEIDKARAEVEQARLNLSYTRIYAPTDGFVTAKAVKPGSYVQVGQSLLAIVPHELWVVANFKETQLTRMRPGQPVTITVDAYPGVPFSGHVDSVQHGTGAAFSLLPPENATGNFVKVVQRVPVKIAFDPSGQSQRYLLVPGMSVVPEVNIAAPARQAGDRLNAQVVPNLATPVRERAWPSIGAGKAVSR